MTEKQVKADLMVVQLDRARTALAEAKTIGETKKIVDMAHAAQIYARRQALGEEAIAYALAIKFEAMRKLGEILQGNGIHRGGSKFREGILNDLGIDGKTSMIAQQLAALPAEQFEQVKDGANSLAEALKYIKKRVRSDEIQEQRAQIAKGNYQTPAGLFDVISLDPPWPYGTSYDPDGRRAANPYPEMSLEQIAAMQLPAALNCILFLWTTHKFMRHSFDLLDGWGFRDVAIITWEKNRIGLGTWLRSNSEFCIMAVKGSPQVDLTNQGTVIHGAQREHSRKPDEFYEMADGLCIGRKLDYFSREPRNGWEQFGNDTNKF